MTMMNIAQAKGRLSELIARAEAGEEVILARNGKPAVRLEAVGSLNRRKPTLGAWDHLNLDIPDAVFFDRDVELEVLLETPIDPTAR